MVDGKSITIGKHQLRGWKIQISSLEIGTIRPRLWREDVIGFRFDIVWGKFKRPIPKFYRWEFWHFSNHKIRNLVNPWNSGNHWFVLSIPFVFLPFISVIVKTKWGNPGFYLGGRTSKMINPVNWALVKEWIAPKKDIFVKDENNNFVHAWGDEKDEGQAHIELSATIRGELLNR